MRDKPLSPPEPREIDLTDEHFDDFARFRAPDLDEDSPIRWECEQYQRDPKNHNPSPALCDAVEEMVRHSNEAAYDASQGGYYD